MEKEEEIKISCPNCSETEMKFDKDYIFCPKCGLLLKIDWIKEISEKLEQLQLITS